MLLNPALFVSVRVHVQEQVKRAELQFQSLPQNHQNLLPNVLSHLAQVSRCAEKNHELLQAIVHNSLHMFENIEYGQRVRLDFHHFTVSFSFKILLLYLVATNSQTQTYVG